jgi:hypothetical protein
MPFQTYCLELTPVAKRALRRLEYRNDATSTRGSRPRLAAVLNALTKVLYLSCQRLAEVDLRDKSIPCAGDHLEAREVLCMI